MDIEYTPHNKILLNYGIIGVILYSFLCLNELKKCKVDSEISYVFYYYLCKIHDEQNNTYFASFSKYFEEFQNFKGSNLLKNLIEIFIMDFGGAILFFLNKYSTILIIKNLTPIHYIFSTPIIFLLHKIVLIIYNAFNSPINGSSFFNDCAPKTKIKIFFFDLIGDILSLLGFLVYLEIVILHFCKLDYNIKVNIMRRSNKDYTNINNLDETITDEILIGDENNQENEENEIQNNDDESIIEQNKGKDNIF